MGKAALKKKMIHRLLILKTQRQAFTTTIPLLLQLSIVRILFRRANHPNTESLGGAFNFHSLPKEGIVPTLPDKAIKREVTEKLLSQEGVQILSSCHQIFETLICRYHYHTIRIQIL